MVDRQKNYYDILEIPTDASPEEVYDGYIRSKNAYSQDSLALYSLMSKDECNQMIESIEEAYGIISDPSKRNAYDRARGITNSYFQKVGSKQYATSNSNDFNDNSDQEKQNEENNNDSKRITKIVATGKYALDYQRDNEFEQEIETTTEFTGGLLKKIREYKQVDINRMSEMTKVSKTYITNIEDENFEKLPATAYIRGFVYQYAKCLKLNPELVATSYLHRLKKLSTK